MSRYLADAILLVPELNCTDRLHQAQLGALADCVEIYVANHRVASPVQKPDAPERPASRRFLSKLAAAGPTWIR